MKTLIMIAVVFASLNVFAKRVPRDCDVVEYEKKGKMVWVIVPEGRSIKLMAMIRSFDTYLEAKIGHIIAVDRGYCESIFDGIEVEEYDDWAKEVFETDG